ncbi:MAG: hypothetical protein JXR34_04320 [Bacteroidales bacterium]|nr:hypothetical protein [Bacteroidales bacterium]
MNPPNPHTAQTQALRAIAGAEGMASSSWNVPYTFSGKEKDAETGYSYFGASPDICTGYDSDLSIWLSVDPLADNYPSMSAYIYAAGNPVMLAGILLAP